MRRSFIALLAGGLVLGASTSVAAEEDETSSGSETAGWREALRGPFRSSRVFALPTAHVVGAYQLSLSGDASLLTESDALSTTSVVALGFGDIAQLEYRSAGAVTETNLVDDETVLDTFGVQLQAPYRSGGWIPAVAAALRLGLPQGVDSGTGVRHEQRADDLYFVASWDVRRRLLLHAGLRITGAQIASEGEGAPESIKETLWLPAAAIEVLLTEEARIAAEVALVPRFSPGAADRASEISRGGFGRVGVRWQLHPALVVDASVGYRIEVQLLEAERTDMARALVDWDLRLGAEVFVPWGALACASTGWFCEQPRDGQ